MWRWTCASGSAVLFRRGEIAYFQNSAEPLFLLLVITGDHPAAVLYGIMHNDPPSLTDYWGDAPEPLQTLIAKALHKDRGVRAIRLTLEECQDLSMRKVSTAFSIPPLERLGYLAYAGSGIAATSDRNC